MRLSLSRLSGALGSRALAAAALSALTGLSAVPAAVAAPTAAPATAVAAATASSEQAGRVCTIGEADPECTSWTSGPVGPGSTGHAYGSDRYRTSALIAHQDFPTAETVIIVNGRTLADAASVGPLASRLHAPVLLVDTFTRVCQSSGGFNVCLGTGEAPANGYLTSTKTLKRAIIVGGTSAVSAAFETSLRQKVSDTTRITGADRYDTSAKIAARPELQGARATFLASGREQYLSDAVALGGSAGTLQMPVLLVDPGAGEQAVNSFLTNSAAGPRRAVAVGAVDAALAQKFNAERLAGADRVETSLMVASWAVMNGVSAEQVTIAATTGVPDALVASAFGYITIFAPREGITAEAKTWFLTNGTKMLHPIGGQAPMA